MTQATVHDSGAYITTKAGAGVGDLITAGGTGDATEINTGWIDRQGYGSCTIFAFGKASVADGETLVASGNLQDSASSDGSSPSDFGTAVSAVTIISAADSAGGITDSPFGEKLGSFNLAGAGRYIRWQGTPNLSASGTDTADICFGIVLGGPAVVPAT